MAEHADAVRTLWRDLTNASHGFDQPLVLVESDDHRSAPPGWVSVVTIAGATVVASPSDQFDDVRRLIEAGSSELVSAALDLPAQQVLGPARLFYDEVSLRRSSLGVVGPIPFDDPRVMQVLDDASADEREECGLDDASSGLYLGVTDDGEPAAVCGWHRWPHDVAHIGVLSARSKRRTGAAARASNQALRAAAEEGLVGQWRAADVNDASIHLARTLGLLDVGSQLSFTLAAP